MTKHNKVCVVSPNHTYEYCSRCRRFDPKETWKNMFCSINCKNIYSIVANYVDKEITKEEALEQLSSCDISDLDNYKQSIRNIILEIMS